MPNLLNRLNFCTYVLLSLKDKEFYIGFTTNLEQRLTAHFCGENKSTAARRPLELIHCEYFLLRADAERREKYFKTAKGKRTLRIMLKDIFAQIQQKALKFS